MGTDAPQVESLIGSIVRIVRVQNSLLVALKVNESIDSSMVHHYDHHVGSTEA